MEHAVEVQGLTKSFTFPVRDGSRGFFGNLFFPAVRSVVAVDGISFSVRRGDTLAFIGPNGAGKSTTIKMMTGILHPTSGRVRVLGLDPQADRRRLAMRIGTVFGQRSQLVFNLPVADSFDLFAKVYEIDDARYRAQRKKLFDVFSLDEIAGQPVRKLSLGQRMRAEIALALLHAPPVIFLDEPTIGLDVVAKRKLRENLNSINREFGTTIFLTSHDAGDIESICERTMVINHGQIIFDGSTGDLRKTYLNRKLVKVAFGGGPGALPSLPKTGLEVEHREDGDLVVRVDTTKTTIGTVLRSVVRSRRIEDITVEDPPLEEIIEDIYGSQSRAK